MLNVLETGLMFLAGLAPIVSLALSFVMRMGDGEQTGGFTRGLITKKQNLFALMPAPGSGAPAAGQTMVAGLDSTRERNPAALCRVPLRGGQWGFRLHKRAQFNAMNWQPMVRLFLAMRLSFCRLYRQFDQMIHLRR